MSAIFGSAYVSGLDTTQHHPSSIFATPGAETVVETDRYEVRFLRNQVTVMKQSAVKYPHLANATVERLVKTINITPRDDEKTYATYLLKTRLHTCWNVLINGAKCGDAGSAAFRSHRLSLPGQPPHLAPPDREGGIPRLPHHEVALPPLPPALLHLPRVTT